MPHPGLSVTLAFGLVNLPVRLYTATASKKVTFRLLDRTTGQRVRQQLVSSGQPPHKEDQATAAASEATALRAPGSTAVSSDPTEVSAFEEGSGSPAEFVVPRQQIIKGYEIERNRYIEVTADELKALEAEVNQHAEIQEFVSLEFPHADLLQRRLTILAPTRVARRCTAYSRGLCGNSGAEPSQNSSCGERKSWCWYDPSMRTV